MAEESLKVVIGADVNGAIAGINKFNTALGKTPATTQRANQALTNLSRVAQDAPFGFIGIANNLDPLLASFQSLSKESGSTKNALKALASSLAGPAGIAVGLSIVSSLVVSAIQKYGSLSAALNAAFGDTSALSRANTELGKSFAEAAGKAGGEIATVRALVSIARDKQLSDNARNEAIKKLNSEYDQYLPKLTLENVTTQEVLKATDALNQSLLRQAKIKGVQDLISDEFKKQALLALELQETVKGASSAIGVLFNSVRGAGNVGVGLLSGLKGINEELSDSKVKASAFEQVLNSLLKDEAVGGTLFDDTKKTKKTKVGKLVDDLKDLQSSLPKTTQQLQNSIIAPFLFGEDFGPDIDTDRIILPIRNLGDAIEEETKRVAGAKLMENLRLQAEQTATTVSDLLTPAFEGFFNTLLTGSGNPFKAFGEAIKRMIAQLAAAVAKAAIFAAIMNVIAPGSGSFGSLFKAGLGGLGNLIGGVANGGINTGTITGSASRGFNVEVTGRMSGTELLFVTNKVNGQIARGF